MSLGGSIGAETAASHVIEMIDKRIAAHKRLYAYRKSSVGSCWSVVRELEALKKKINREIIEPAKDGWY